MIQRFSGIQILIIFVLLNLSMVSVASAGAKDCAHEIALAFHSLGFSQEQVGIKLKKPTDFVRGPDSQIRSTRRPPRAVDRDFLNDLREGRILIDLRDSRRAKIESLLASLLREVLRADLYKKLSFQSQQIRLLKEETRYFVDPKLQRFTGRQMLRSIQFTFMVTWANGAQATYVARIKFGEQKRGEWGLQPVSRSELEIR